MNLKNDIARCYGQECRYKSACSRHTQITKDIQLLEKTREPKALPYITHCRDEHGLELLFIPEITHA